MSSEKGPAFYHVDPYVNATTNEVTSEKFTHKVKVTGPMMIYGGTAKIKPSSSARRLICRHWIEAFDGKILHETTSAYEWASTDNAEELHRVCYAEYVDIPANADTVSLLASIPMPITDYKTAFDIKMCWEFKEPITLLGVDADTIMYSLEREDGTIDKVASQRYVDDKFASMSPPGVTVKIDMGYISDPCTHFDYDGGTL
jgi:hypothetical protein